MNIKFTDWLMCEEIFPNKTATVFHRAGGNATSETIEKILNSDFKAGAGVGCAYGCGLYATFNLESQFSQGMNSYGPWIIKFKLTDLDKYIIIPPTVAKFVKGERWKLSEQLEDLIPEIYEKEKSKNPHKWENIDSSQETSWKNGFMPSFIQERCKGVLYYDSAVGYAVVKYMPVNDGTVSMVGYALANANDLEKMEELQSPKNWTTTASDVKIRDIYSRKDKSGRVFGVQEDKLSRADVFQMLKNQPEEAEKLDKREFDKLGNIEMVELMKDSRRDYYLKILGPKFLDRIRKLDIGIIQTLFWEIMDRSESGLQVFKDIMGDKLLNQIGSHTLLSYLFSDYEADKIKIRGRRLGGFINRISPVD